MSIINDTYIKVLDIPVDFFTAVMLRFNLGEKLTFPVAITK